jgi:RNA polymerase sigma-70 factor (ECF subfamily)
VTEKDPMFSDDEIVRSVRDGRTQRFEVLVNRYKNRIVNFIHKMIFDHDESQSLAQDVFIKVFESIGKYKSQDNFQAFIFTIAKNLTLNHIKKQKRFQWFSGEQGSGEMEGRHFRTNGTQEEDIEKRRQDELMNEALKNLKENQRIALILKIYLEFSYKKIAEITGWSEPKIETLISRAKSNLRSYIQTRENPGADSRRSSKRTFPVKENLQENKRSNVLEVRST